MRARAIFASMVLLGVVAACGAATSVSDQAPSRDAGPSETGGGKGPCEAALTFEVRAGGAYCAGTTSSCNNEWLTILGPDGKPVPRDLSCSSECGECALLGCAAVCPAPSPVPAAGLSQTWAGRYFTSGKCTTAQGDNVSCGVGQCAAAGKYVARMCLYVDGSAPDGGADAADAAASSPERCRAQSAGAKPTCVDVPFDWPSTKTVVGTIP